MVADVADAADAVGTAQRNLLLAQAALKAGRPAVARAQAQAVLDAEPSLPAATQHDGQRRNRLVAAAVGVAVDADIAGGATVAAKALADEYWAADPVDPYVFAARVRAAEAVGGELEALRELGISLVRPLPEPAGAGIVCLSVCRDEMDQLASFLAHHRLLGVRRFVVVDNGSTDGSHEFLARQPDVELWHTALGFRELAFGAAAFTAIARRYLVDRWCLILDADERFVLPPGYADLPSLVAALEAGACHALPGLLVDVYTDAPLDSAGGPVPLHLEGDVYLDRTWMHGTHEHAGPFGNGRHLVGGVRNRVFGSEPEFLLSKVPLVKYTHERLLVGGQHDTNAPPLAISTGRAALLHTKFLAGPGRLSVEAERAQHANAAGDYARYAAALRDRPELTLFDPDHSVAYQGPGRLAEMGITLPLR